MFKKLKQWILNRKLIKLIKVDKIDFQKILDVIESGADISKIIDELDVNDVKKIFSLKEIETLIYKKYEKIYGKKHCTGEIEKAETKKRLEKFNLNLNEDLLKISKDLSNAKKSLKVSKKSQKLWYKISKFFSSIFYKEQKYTEEAYLEDFFKDTINKLLKEQKQLINSTDNQKYNWFEKYVEESKSRLIYVVLTEDDEKQLDKRLKECERNRRINHVNAQRHQNWQREYEIKKATNLKQSALFEEVNEKDSKTLNKNQNNQNHSNNASSESTSNSIDSKHQQSDFDNCQSI